MRSSAAENRVPGRLDTAKALGYMGYSSNKVKVFHRGAQHRALQPSPP